MRTVDCAYLQLDLPQERNLRLPCALTGRSGEVPFHFVVGQLSHLSNFDLPMTSVIKVWVRESCKLKVIKVNLTVKSAK